jgi:hypothetical protein
MGHSVPRPPGAGWCAVPKRSRGAAMMRATRHATRTADRAWTPAITSKCLRLYRRARQLAAGTLRNTPRNLGNARSRAIPPAGRHRLHSELGHSDSVTYLYWGGPPGWTSSYRPIWTATPPAEQAAPSVGPCARAFAYLLACTQARAHHWRRSSTQRYALRLGCCCV